MHSAERGINGHEDALLATRLVNKSVSQLVLSLISTTVNVTQKETYIILYLLYILYLISVR